MVEANAADNRRVNMSVGNVPGASNSSITAQQNIKEASDAAILATTQGSINNLQLTTASTIGAGNATAGVSAAQAWRSAVQAASQR